MDVDGPETQGWYYLDGNKQSQGPFPVSYLQELNKCSYFNAETLFWRESQGEWKPLKDLPSLEFTLKQAPPPSSSATALATRTNAIASAPAVKSSGPTTAAATSDPQLQNFLAEISTIEEETAAAAAAEGDVPESPPPGERSFIDDDGTEYLWNSGLRKFVPAGEQGAALTVIPEAAYSVEDMVYVPDAEGIPKAPPRPTKDGDGEGEEVAAPDGQQPPAEPSTGTNPDKPAPLSVIEKAQERAKRAREKNDQTWIDLKRITSVYVTGLPDDVTETELAEMFAKCGIIKQDPETQLPKVKVYRDQATGYPKGDGLVTYLKEPSVELAIQLLDGTPFRYGLPMNMSVSRAKFEPKGGNFVAKNKSNSKLKKKRLEQQEKQLGWHGFDDVLKPQQITVIIKHMFHPDEFLANPLYKEELQRDILSEAEKLGTVTKVKIFSGNPEGVVSIKFTTEEAADACVVKMNGRWFAGRQLEAGKWDGTTNYNVKLVETEEQQQARLEAYARELEASGVDMTGE